MDQKDINTVGHKLLIITSENLYNVGAGTLLGFFCVLFQDLNIFGFVFVVLFVGFTMRGFSV